MTDGTIKTKRRSPAGATIIRNSSAQVGKAHRQARFLDLVASGFSFKAACDEVGIAVNTYERWCVLDPMFKAKARALRFTESATARKGTVSFVKFREVFFGHSTPAHHLLMTEALDRAEPDSLTCVLTPPEGAKTSLAVDWMNYRLAVDPNFRIAVISEGQDLARKIVGQVATRMTDEALFDAYIKMYGPFRTPLGEKKDYVGRPTGKPWNADYLQVHKASHDEKEPSLEARGAGSTLYGGRYDLMLLDDIQSDRNLGNTRALLRYVRQTVLTRPQKGKGHTVFFGSRVGPEDIYNTMAAEEMLDSELTIPALTRWVDRDDHFTVIDGKVKTNPAIPEQWSFWPEHWSIHDLAVRRKAVGEEVWSRTYMQRTVAVAEATFTEAMIDAVKDRTRTAGNTVQGTFRMLSVDPALDKGICAYTVGAATATKLWLLDQHAIKDTRRYEDIYVHIASLAATYRPSYVVIEQNNFQKGLHQDDRMLDLAKRFGFTVVPHQTSRNKHDSVLGVAMMASAFVDAEISVPWADDLARRTFGPLFDEARLWRPSKRGSELTQDRLMTLWFMWLHWQKIRSYYAPTLAPLSRHVPSWLANRPRGMST